MSTRSAPVRAMSEDDFKSRIIATAKWHDWRICHFRPGRRKSGKWSTPLEGHSGLPDLVLARDGVVLLVELKSQTGRVSADQADWLAAAGEHGLVWRPSDWPAALALLSAPRRVRSGR